MQQDRSSARILLTVTVVAVILFNLVYWIGKFFPDLISVVTDLRLQLLAHWGLFMFLEFLAVISLFVDLIVRWDEFGTRLKGRLALTGILIAGWVFRMILGVIDLYMIGTVQ